MSREQTGKNEQIESVSLMPLLRAVFRWEAGDISEGSLAVSF